MDTRTDNGLNQKEWTARTPADMEEIASWLIATLAESSKKTSGSAGASVVGLYGDLGAGKTTFSQMLAKKLGVTEHVTSPTFVIQKIYALDPAVSERYSIPFAKLVHIDAYRLGSSRELSVLGWQELLAEPETLIVIEWPERVADIMPPHVQMRFALEGEHTRHIAATYI